MSFIANSTANSAVFRKDGVRLYGFDAELEVKAQEKRDEEWEGKLLDWVEQVVGEKVERAPLDSVLKSGVLLCKMMNKIEPGSIKKIDTRAIAMCQVENINNYLKGCWKLGVPSAELFVASDLFQGKGVPQVVVNLWSVIRIVQSREGWDGPVLGPKVSKKGPSSKKWADVETNNQYKRLEDIERIEAERYANSFICMKCYQLGPKTDKFCKHCGTPYDMEDPKVLRARLEEEQAKRSQLEKELSELRNLIKDQQISSQKEEDSEKAKLREEVALLRADLESVRERAQRLESSQAFMGEETERLKLENDQLRQTLQSSKDEQFQQLTEQYEQLQEKYQVTLRNAKKQGSLGSDDRQKFRTSRMLSKTQWMMEETPASMDSSQLELCREFVKRLFSEDVEFEECRRLQPILQMESGRREFVQCVKSTMKTMLSKVASDSSFEILLFLVNFLLKEMDEAGSRDFITAKKLIKFSTMLSRDGSKEFLKDFIKDHEVWKDLQFWQEYFLGTRLALLADPPDELFQKHRRHFPDETEVDRDFVSTLFCSFILNMETNWNLSEASILYFVKNTIYSSAFYLKDPGGMEREIESFVRHFSEEKRTSQRRMSGFGAPVKKKKEAQSQSDIIKQGTLEKLAENGKSWQQRWFVLRSGCLEYKSKEKEKKVKKGITLGSACSVSEFPRKSRNCIVLSGSDLERDYFLCASNQDEQNEWISAIRNAITS